MTDRRQGEPKRKRVESEVRRLLLDSGLPEDRRILLAVSGGADSTALLSIMARLEKNLRLQLAIAHFDHGLRGARIAQREERFVRELAVSLDLPFHEGSARGKRIASEDAARRARYEFLATVAAREGFSAVATGHTASDQAETVLLHLVRGTGLDGLAGMSARAKWPFSGNGALTLLRPLLRLSRQETEAYCASAGISPVEDASNASPRYRRNRVRHELLPLLRQMNPAIEDAMVRLAEAAGEDVSFLHSVAVEALLDAREGSQRLSSRVLAAWPASPRRHALRLAMTGLLGDAQEMTQRHLLGLERLLLEGKTGDRLDLPRGVVAVLRRDALELRLEAEPSQALPDKPVMLQLPAESRYGRFLVAASTKRPASGESVEVAASVLEDGLCVRSWQPGDRFNPLGMRGQKKLQDFFTDAHVPREDRESIPLFVSSRGIVWVGGLRIAEWARPRPGESTAYLSFRPA